MNTYEIIQFLFSRDLKKKKKVFVRTCTLLRTVKSNSGSEQLFSLLLSPGLLTSVIKYNGLTDMPELKWHSQQKHFTKVRVKLRRAPVQPQRTELLAEGIRASPRGAEVFGIRIALLELTIYAPNSQGSCLKSFLPALEQVLQ